MIITSATQSTFVVSVCPGSRDDLNNQNYTFVLKNKDTLAVATFSSAGNLNPYWVGVTFSDATPVAATGPNIQLPLNRGEHLYKVYQTADVYDLSLSSTHSLIETGIWLHTGTFSTIRVSPTPPNNQIRVSK
jgi:hypothetical protein